VNERFALATSDLDFCSLARAEMASSRLPNRPSRWARGRMERSHRSERRVKD
jgi:hypothetical protein